jgi:hypothetical protein
VELVAITASVPHWGCLLCCKNLFLESWLEAHELNEKVVLQEEDAIKNSANQDPEGYWTKLDSAMCNAGLVL